VEGSVRKSGRRVRVTAQLIDVNTGHHIMVERCDRDLTDLFELQDEKTLRSPSLAATLPTFDRSLKPEE
jgi:adenylate cyclase